MIPNDIGRDLKAKQQFSQRLEKIIHKTAKLAHCPRFEANNIRNKSKIFPSENLVIQSCMDVFSKACNSNQILGIISKPAICNSFA